MVLKSSSCLDATPTGAVSESGCRPQHHENEWHHSVEMRNRVRNNVRALSILCLTILPLPAQWLNQPTAGIPRTADGKPNLAASAPKASDGKPDLSGLWRLGVEIGIGANIITDLPP